MTIVWAPRAIRHLQELRAYLAQDSPAAAGRVAALLLAAVDHLADHPGLGRPGRIAGTRELVVPDTPFVIPYRVRADRIEIIAVFHGRRQWPTAL